MKVKNIMFSGVMGVILMSVASSANAAISVASKAYVDTKASSVEAAYKEADEALDGKITAMDEAYKAADTALDGKISANAQEITTIKGLTGTEGVAKQIENALKVETEAREAAVSALEDADEALDGRITANTEAIATKVAQTAYDAKVGELEAADETLEGKITANTAAIGALDATYVSETEMNTFKSSNTDAIADAKKAGTDAADALAAYKTTNDAAVADAKKAGTDAADALAAYKTTNDAAVQKNASDIAALDTTYVSESELNTFKTSNTEAIADAKKAGTDAADALAEYKTTNDAAVAANKTATETNAAAIETKVDQSDYDTKVTEIENDLLTKIEMPAACETQDCVLSINKASGTVSWTPLTEPVADFID